MAEKQFTVENRTDYIYLKTWGDLEVEGLEEPAEAALALSHETGVNKLLDNIQEVNAAVSLPVQLKGVSILWKLRQFSKVAVVVKQNELSEIFFGSLSTLNLNKSAFRGFDNETEAIVWLNSSQDDIS